MEPRLSITVHHVQGRLPRVVLPIKAPHRASQRARKAIVANLVSHGLTKAIETIQSVPIAIKPNKSDNRLWQGRTFGKTDFHCEGACHKAPPPHWGHPGGWCGDGSGVERDSLDGSVWAMASSSWNVLVRSLVITLASSLVAMQQASTHIRDANLWHTAKLTFERRLDFYPSPSCCYLLVARSNT